MATSQKVLNCRGVKQGCPLSTYLFIIAIEMLAVKIRSNNNIKELEIHGLIVTRGQYFHFWKNNVPVVNGIFCQDKMLEYAYN